MALTLTAEQRQAAEYFEKTGVFKPGMSDEQKLIALFQVKQQLSAAPSQQQEVQLVAVPQADGSYVYQYAMQPDIDKAQEAAHKFGEQLHQQERIGNFLTSPGFTIGINAPMNIMELTNKNGHSVKQLFTSLRTFTPLASTAATAGAGTTGGFLSVLSKFSKFGGNRIPVVGSLFSATDDFIGGYHAVKSGDTKELGKSAIRATTTIGAAASGAAAGFALGSFVPVVGNAVGFVLGGAIGALGGWLGSKAGREIADATVGKSDTDIAKAQQKRCEAQLAEGPVVVDPALAQVIIYQQMQAQAQADAAASGQQLAINGTSTSVGAVGTTMPSGNAAANGNKPNFVGRFS